MEHNKFYLEGKIKLQKETPDLKAQAAKAIDLPEEDERQPDLLYLSAILVSSGENLNHAYFLPSELVAAESSISFKALDVEHQEKDIIGIILDKAYVDKEGNKLDLKELSFRETSILDKQEMHIAITAILYKNRFPNIAKEVAAGKWDSVSMECYYQDYDIKIGDLILDSREAETLGLASKDESMMGRAAKVIKDGKEIAKGVVVRVLKGICFCGCGIVKNPANPPSIIMEVAEEKPKDKDDDVIILDYDSLKEEEGSNEKGSNNITVDKADAYEKEESVESTIDSSKICVYYKRSTEEDVPKDNWCVAYQGACTSSYRDTSDQNCLRNKNIARFAKEAFDECSKKKAKFDRRKELLDGLRAALREAVKTQSQ